MKRKVYTDGNGSVAVLIDGLGHYIPVNQAVALEKEIDQLKAQIEQQEKQLKTLIASLAVNAYDEALKEIDLLRLAAGHGLELQTKVEQLREANQKLIPLARRCLWGALVWSDHNFDQPLHVYCRESVSEAGIINVDQANSFLAEAGEI